MKATVLVAALCGGVRLPVPDGCLSDVSVVCYRNLDMKESGGAKSATKFIGAYVFVRLNRTTPVGGGVGASALRRARGMWYNLRQKERCYAVSYGL